jgi:hypothetical protein
MSVLMIVALTLFLIGFVCAVGLFLGAVMALADSDLPLELTEPCEVTFMSSGTYVRRLGECEGRRR